MIESITILSEHECEHVVQTLHTLRTSWVRRHPMAPFFTLGNPSYLDGASPPSASYLDACCAGNAMLGKSFTSLYQRLESVLRDHTQVTVKPAPLAALPGFHIFLAHKAFTRSVASLHLDLQYQKIHWPTPDFYDTTRPLSFTLTLSLPASGGGLTWWDLDETELLPLSKQALRERITHTAPQYFPYTVGMLALHSGHMLHQIAPSARMEKSESRITLQGHGLYASDGCFYYYW